MALPLGLGIAGLGVAGLGAGLGFFSQNQANRQNQRNFEASLAETRRQFDTSLRYNSAQSQVRRLRAAGLNPAFVFGQGSAQASSSGAPTGSAIQAYTPDFSGALDGFLMSSQIDANKSSVAKNFADADLVNQQAAAQEISNLYLSMQREKEIENMSADTQLKKKLYDINELQRQFDSSTLQERVRRITIDNDYQSALRDSVSISNQYLPQRCKVEINKIIAEEAAAYMNGRASLNQAHAAIMSAANQQRAFDAQYGGTPNDRNAFFRATLDYLVQKRNESSSQEWRNQFFSTGQSIHGPFGTGYSRNGVYQRKSPYPHYSTGSAYGY